MFYNHIKLNYFEAKKVVIEKEKIELQNQVKKYEKQLFNLQIKINTKQKRINDLSTQVKEKENKIKILPIIMISENLAKSKYVTEGSIYLKLLVKILKKR